MARTPKNTNRLTIGAPVDASIVAFLDEEATRLGTDRATVIRWFLAQACFPEVGHQERITAQLAKVEALQESLKLELSEYNVAVQRFDLNNINTYMFRCPESERIFKQVLPHMTTDIQKHELLRATLLPEQFRRISAPDS